MKANTILGALMLSAGLLAMSSMASATVFGGVTVNTVGSANVLGDGTLQLTNTYWEAGAAWATTAWSTTSSFDTSFNVSLQAFPGVSPQADGLAFVLQNQGTSALGYEGGYIGVGGLSPSVAGGIQTWGNNTAGFSNDGNPYAAKSAGFNLGGANSITGTVDVSYNVNTNLLSFTANLNADGTPLLLTDSETVNLQSKFGNTVYAGFTGGTGGSESNEIVSNWTVSAVPEADTYALFGIGVVATLVLRKRRQTV